jgi:hypothetical protein
VTGAADDGQIGGIEARRHRCSRLGTGNIHSRDSKSSRRQMLARAAE